VLAIVHALQVLWGVICPIFVDVVRNLIGK